VSVWKLAIAAVGTALLLAACGGSSSGVGGASACSPTGGTTSGTGSQVVKINPDPNTVGRFDSSTVSITTGQSVEWDWVDNSAQHSVTSDNNPPTFDSGLCSAGTKFVVTFSSAGDFKYHCTIHSGMLGDVKVS
jgi:plastocyanin